MRTKPIVLPCFELDNYIKESIDFLQEHEPPEGYFVGFSGGKDSIVSLHLCKLAGVKHQAFFQCTRIDPPELYKFIRTQYPEVLWLYPKKIFWQEIQRLGPPFRRRRWCCNVLKKDTGKQANLKHKVLGIRTEESARRASRPRIDTYYGQIVYKPIFYWPEWAIWEFIETHKLPYPSLYDEGFSRIGCIVCPFILSTHPGSVRQREMSMKRWPGTWKTFEHAVKRWWNKNATNGKWIELKSVSADAYWQEYLVGFEKH